MLAQRAFDNSGVRRGRVDLRLGSARADVRPAHRGPRVSSANPSEVNAASVVQPRQPEVPPENQVTRVG